MIATEMTTHTKGTFPTWNTVCPSDEFRSRVSCTSHSRHLNKFGADFRRLVNHPGQFCFRDCSYFVEGKNQKAHFDVI